MRLLRTNLLLATGQVTRHGHLGSIPVLYIGEYVEDMQSTAVTAESAEER
jgi:hypothetical protein